MILYMNVIVTEARHHYQRYHLPNFSRLDVFKYVLASYSVIPWSRVIIHAPLDTHFAGLEDHLSGYIHELFGDKATYYPHRATTLKEWQVNIKEVEEFDDDLVWFTCNDDHVFIDYDLELVKEVCGYLKAEENPHSCCYFSHWHEAIRAICAPNLPQVTKVGNFAVNHWNVHDSIQIMRKELLTHYFSKLPIEGVDLRRTDFIQLVAPTQTKCYVPLREMVRHFDGYQYATECPDALPPLCVPPGFFEKDIKILYCGDHNKPGWVSISPMNNRTRAAWGDAGVDMRCMLEDLPLFWKGRITEIEVGKEYPREDLIYNRNELIEWIIQNLAMKYPLMYGQYQYVHRHHMPMDWFKIAMR